MPGFAGAKPGTGQTATAIIAPASCRHDNCIGRCLIMQQLSDFPLYSAALRPLPAGSPPGPALHNRYVMQTGACQNSTPAPLSRRTPYTIPKPAHASCRVSQGFGSFAASHLSASRKALRAFRRSRQCPRLTTPCHLMSSKLTRLCLVSSRHEPWTLNAGFNSPSIPATGNSPALPARRPKGAPKSTCLRKKLPETKVSSNFY
jgi:hypothetical protein